MVSRKPADAPPAGGYSRGVSVPPESPAVGSPNARNRRVAIVDDHAIVREGLAVMLAAEGYEIVLRAGDAASAIGPLVELAPDVAVIDIGLPGESGLSLVARLVHRAPSVGVVLFTGAEDEHELARALASGARGLAMKGADPSETLRAVHAVAAGGRYIDPRVRAVVAAGRPAEPVARLSPRERQVLELVSRGDSVDAIAAKLVISRDTVRTHVRNAIRRLGAENRTHAIALSLRSGEIAL